MCMASSLTQIRHSLFPSFGAQIEIGLRQIVQCLEILVGQVLLTHGVHGVLGLVIPAQRAVAQCHPQARLGHRRRQPGEVFGDVIEGSGGSQKIAVHVLGFTHRHP